MKYICPNSKCGYKFYGLGEQIDHTYFWEFRTNCPKCGTVCSWWLRKCFIINKIKIPGWLARALINLLITQLLIWIANKWPWLKPIVEYFLKPNVKGGETVASFWENVAPLVLDALMSTEAFDKVLEEVAKKAEAGLPDFIEPHFGQILIRLGQKIAD